MNEIISVLKAIVSPLGLFIIGILVFCFFALRSSTNFSDIGLVLRDYYSVFAGAKKHILLYWGTPLLFAASIIQVTAITPSLSESLVVFLSILISGFFAMLSILASKASSRNNPLYKEVLNGAVSTVLIEILLCIITILLTLAVLFLGTEMHLVALYVISFFVYYAIFVMLLNILIIIKRLKALIDNA